VVRARFLSAALLAGVTLLAAAGTTGFLLRPAVAPDDLRAAPQVTSAPVGHEQLTDERNVQVSLHTTPAPPLVVGLTGRVTSSACAPGRPLRSGHRVARINEQPVVALTTSVPLYRDLRSGLRGADVRALQVELRRLKHHVRPTGRYDRRTATAVRKVRAAAGTVRPDGTLPLAQVLWLPAPAVTPDACKLVPGTFVSAGGVFATSAPRLTSVTVDAMPQRTVRGARVIKLMGATGPLGDDGTATDAAFRAKVAGGQEYRLFAQSGSTDEITAVIRLRHPVPTLKVPPGAVFGVRDDRGCVASAGRAYPVRIMGSRLGATLVTMDGAAPSSVDLGTAADHSACG